MIMRHWILGCLMGFCMVSWTFADEKPRAMIPVAVSNAVAHQFPGAAIEKAEIETEGIKVFELEIEQSGLEADITVTPEGLILEVETEVALNRIPPAVREALKGLAAREDIKEVSKEAVYGEVIVKHHKSPKVAYEADIQRDGHSVTVKLDSEGKILAREVEDHVERGKRVRDQEERADDEGQAEHQGGQEHSAAMMQNQERGDHEDNEADEVREQHNSRDKVTDNQGLAKPDDDDEILLNMHEIPQAVRATIDKHLRDGKVTEIELKIDHGHIVYAVEVTQGKHEVDLLISAKGKFLGTEDEAAEQGKDKGRTTKEKGHEDD